MVSGSLLSNSVAVFVLTCGNVVVNENVLLFFIKLKLSIELPECLRTTALTSSGNIVCPSKVDIVRGNGPTQDIRDQATQYQPMTDEKLK